VKPSRFNLFFEREDGRTAVYNTLSGRVVALERRVAAVLRRADPAGQVLARHLLTPSQQSELRAARLLVGDDTDELQVPIWHFQRRRCADDEARVLVLTTRHCNLRCPYCYESGLPLGEGMTPETAARSVRFVERLVSERRCRTASVGFYGGEPLLNLEAMLGIMVPLRAFARRRGLPIEFPVTTNGALLTRVRESALFEHASSFHVTFDGAREGHDRLRRTADGHGSYDAILAGVALLCERGLRVIVRIHHNELDGAGLRRVLDDLHAAGLRPGAKAAVYTTNYGACHAAADAAQCRRDLAATRLAGREREHELAAAVRGHALEPLLGFESSRPSSPLPARSTGCTFASLTTWAVDASGDLYKCPDDLRPQARVGTLDEDGAPRWSERYFEIFATRWWQDSACAACEFLPVCGSGCALAPPPARLEDCAARREWYRAAAEHYALRTGCVSAAPRPAPYAPAR
jgi:uncharacterized protein